MGEISINCEEKIILAISLVIIGVYLYIEIHSSAIGERRYVSWMSEIQIGLFLLIIVLRKQW